MSTMRYIFKFIRSALSGFGPPGPSFPPNHPASISPAVGNVPPGGPGSAPPVGPSGPGNSSHPNILVPAGPPPSGSQTGQQSSSQGMPPPRGSFGSGRVIPVGTAQGPGGPIGSAASTAPSQSQGGSSQVLNCFPVRVTAFSTIIHRTTILLSSYYKHSQTDYH